MEGNGCYLLDLRDPNIGSQRGCGCKNERSDNIPPSAVGEINVVEGGCDGAVDLRVVGVLGHSAAEAGEGDRLGGIVLGEGSNDGPVEAGVHPQQSGVTANKTLSRSGPLFIAFFSFHKTKKRSSEEGLQLRGVVTN